MADSESVARFPGFRRPTYTLVPDEVFDELLAELSGGEVKVLLYIIRRTFGFKKDSDTISLKQLSTGIVTKDGRRLDRGAGVSHGTAETAVRGLIDKGIIVAQRNATTDKGDQPTTYALRFAQGVANFWPRGVPEIGGGRGQELATQETEGQQYRRQQSGATRPAPAPAQEYSAPLATRYRCRRCKGPVIEAGGIPQCRECGEFYYPRRRRGAADDGPHDYTGGRYGHLVDS